jgi:hypothetical protein
MMRKRPLRHDDGPDIPQANFVLFVTLGISTTSRLRMARAVSSPDLDGNRGPVR